MGALHNGHLSLIRASRQQCDVTVASIFVNPTQFNDAVDFEKYPVTIENDILLLEKAGCTVLFLPSVKEMYPDGLTMKHPYGLGGIEFLLEGSFRPGHFQGVCQVVNRLLDIVQPQQLFLGQKDYQQCLILTKLIELTGKQNSIQIKMCLILREPSGLAMSSRNVRLSAEGKEKATAIYQSLQFIQQNITTLPIETLIQQSRQRLTNAGFEKADYIAIVNAHTLEAAKTWDQQIPLVALIAATINGVRLIDNLKLN
jgi:pantoate--beta-alanine ligase